MALWQLMHIYIYIYYIYIYYVYIIYNLLKDYTTKAAFIYINIYI